MLTPTPWAISHDEQPGWVIFSDDDNGGNGNVVGHILNEDDAELIVQLANSKKGGKSVRSWPLGRVK